jgi:hypothetical protein
MYQYLDNQALADLLAGRLPAAWPTAGKAGLPRVQFWVRGDPARDRETLLESLRRALPDAGAADIRVDGASWRPGEVGRANPAVGEEVVPFTSAESPATRESEKK